MNYYTAPQVICRKCGTSTKETREACPICGSELGPWKGVPVPVTPENRASTVRQRAAGKGICGLCQNSFPADTLQPQADGTKLCPGCVEIMAKKQKKQ